MSGVRVVEFMTLDGVVQGTGPNGEVPHDFPHADWMRPFMASHAADMPDVFRRAGGFLFGRRTYDIFAAHWPTVTAADDVIAEALNGRPKFVVSSTLRQPTWRHTTVLPDATAARIQAAAAGFAGDLVVLGSCQLAQSLMAAGVVETYQLWLHPVVLGSGQRLFTTRSEPAQLVLTGSRVADGGLVILDYRAAGTPPRCVPRPDPRAADVPTTDDEEPTTTEATWQRAG